MEQECLHDLRQVAKSLEDVRTRGRSASRFRSRGSKRTVVRTLIYGKRKRIGKLSGRAFQNLLIFNPLNFEGSLDIEYRWG